MACRRGGSCSFSFAIWLLLLLLVTVTVTTVAPPTEDRSAQWRLNLWQGHLDDNDQRWKLPILVCKLLLDTVSGYGYCYSQLLPDVSDRSNQSTIDITSNQGFLTSHGFCFSFHDHAFDIVPVPLCVHLFQKLILLFVGCWLHSKYWLAWGF